MKGVSCSRCRSYNLGELARCLVCGTALTRPEPAAGRASAPASGPPAAPLMPPPWQATHRVPAGGVSAWTEADGSQPPAARLDAGVLLELLREWGAWAEVRAQNGWKGWVDTRLLESVRGVGGR